MGRKKKSEDESHHHVKRPKQVLIKGNFTDFASSYRLLESDANFTSSHQVFEPDTKKRFEGNVMLSIHSIPDDLLRFYDYINLNPNALNHFLTRELLFPKIRELQLGPYISSRRNSQKRQSALVKKIKLQSALLYRFLKYCWKENAESYPEFLPYLGYDLTKGQPNALNRVSPLKATAFYLEKVFGKLRADMGCPRPFYDSKMKLNSFRRGYLEDGEKILRQENIQDELKTLLRFTIALVMCKQYGDPEVFSIIFDLNNSLKKRQYDGTDIIMTDFKTLRRIEVAAKNALGKFYIS